MSNVKPYGLKPDIIVSEADERSLTRLAADALGRSPDLGKELLAEIERACVVPGTSVPRGVVQMGSIVEFRQEGGRTRRVQLLYPGQADIALNRISIHRSGQLSWASGKVNRSNGKPTMVGHAA